MKAPFPWFGGKSRVAADVWQRFGYDVQNYGEPFCGSLAVPLGRPGGAGPNETVNDKDGFVCNFWRAIQADPEAVAHYADWPVNENDLHARHAWLKPRRAELSARLEGDPDYFDAKIAGWWVWGISVWIGGGFCGDSHRGAGPWVVEDGMLVNGGQLAGVTRGMPSLHDRGMHRKRPMIGKGGHGITRQRIQTSCDNGINGQTDIYGWFATLSDRLRRVRVCCGDWRRILGQSPTTAIGMTAVFLDPPYGADTGRDRDLYSEDSGTVAAEVRDWAVENGDNPLLRIALCGYEGEHQMPDSWECLYWTANGGMANQGDSRENRRRERIWFSPACLKARLF